MSFDITNIFGPKLRQIFELFQYVNKAEVEKSNNFIEILIQLEQKLQEEYRLTGNNQIKRIWGFCNALIGETKLSGLAYNSIPYFKNAIEIDPECYDFTFNAYYFSFVLKELPVGFAIVFSLKSKYEEIYNKEPNKKNLQKVISINQIIGDFYRRVGNNEKGAHYYRNEIDLSPDRLCFSHLKYAKAHRFNEAISTIKERLKENHLNWDQGHYLTLMGDSYYELQDKQTAKHNYKAAIEAYYDVLKDNPQSRIAWLNIVNCYEKLENHDNVRNALREVLKITQLNEDSVAKWKSFIDKADWYCVTGYVYEKLNMVEQAVKYYKMAQKYYFKYRMYEKLPTYEPYPEDRSMGFLYHIHNEELKRLVTFHELEPRIHFLQTQRYEIHECD